MIVGSGDIAKTLIEMGIDRPNVTFFASGVSNSKETRWFEFEREHTLLEFNKFQNHIVYFSSMYADHKKHMERALRSNTKSYTIIRLGNITWGNNPNTIINFFKAEYAAGRTPDLQDTYRHLVSREQFEYWIRQIRVGVNDIMNIPGELTHVNEIWRDVQQEKY